MLPSHTQCHQHHDKSTNCSSCTCTHLCCVGTLKHEVWLSSLLYLSCLLVCTTGLLEDQDFTNMGLPMCQWLHWKYHFTWSGPCTVSVGRSSVFLQLACLHACLFNYFSFTFSFALSLLCCLLVRLFHIVCLFRSQVSFAWNHVWILKRARWSTRGFVQLSLLGYMSSCLCMKNLLCLVHDIEGKCILFKVNLGENTILAH